MMQKYFERVYQSIRHFWTLTLFNVSHLDVCLTELIIELIVGNTLINTEEIDRNSFGFTFRLVEEPEFLKITIAKHKSLSLIDDAKVF